jgi:hypothetical protein
MRLKPCGEVWSFLCEASSPAHSLIRGAPPAKSPQIQQERPWLVWYLEHCKCRMRACLRFFIFVRTCAFKRPLPSTTKGGFVRTENKFRRLNGDNKPLSNSDSYRDVLRGDLSLQDHLVHVLRSASSVGQQRPCCAKTRVRLSHYFE